MPSVAVVGASSRPERPSHLAVERYVEAGWTVWPVHPSGIAVAGIETLRSLGALYARRERWDRARALYGDGVRSHPYKVDLHLGLAEALEAQGEHEQAAASYQRAAELDERSAAAHRGLGLALARLGQRARAVECLRKAVRVAPDDARALHALARAHRDRGERELARAVFERLAGVAAPGSPEARAARAYLAEGSKAA